MASGRNAAHTAEAEPHTPPGEPSAGTARSRADTARADTNERSSTTGYADTERLGLEGLGTGGDVADRPAHQWEVGEVDSWEPSVTDTWNPPLPGNSPPSGKPPGASAPRDSAQVAAGAAALPAERSVPPTVPPAERAVQSARQALDQALQSAEPEAGPPDPARMAIGLASLAAERVRAGVPAGDGLVTGFGLARQTANGLLALGERLLQPASRLTASALQGASRLPVAGLPVRAALWSGQWVARSGAQVREKVRAWFEGVPRPNRGASPMHEAGPPHEAGPNHSATNTFAAGPSTEDSPQGTLTLGPGTTARRP